MKRSAAFLLPVLGIVIFSRLIEPVHSEDQKDEIDGDKRQQVIQKKISTLLLINDKSRNQTDLVPFKSPKAAVDSAVTSLIVFGNETSKYSNETDEDFEGESSTDQPEALPEPLELRNLPPGNRRRPYHRFYTSRRPMPPPVDRRNVYSDVPVRPVKRPIRKPGEPRHEPTDKDCTFFGKTVCLKTLNYPQELILRSIRNNAKMAAALLKDYNVPRDEKSDNLNNDFLSFDQLENNEIKRRSNYGLDNVEEGFTCPSQVMYARPQLARAASGVWKYIINTGEHTQTLRLEKCLQPKSSCSFISENYRSSCIQVYNYHRLLTWDNNLGLHMDIFKIPSCCSCHIHGYTELYPPVDKDPISVDEEIFPGADFSTDQNNDQTVSRPTSYLTKHKPSHNFDTSFVNPSKTKGIADSGSSHRPTYTSSGRPRRKKPITGSTPMPKPYDHLPQQHAPNTRAPGYKGPVIKSSKRPSRPSRPYRRESNPDENTSKTNLDWFSQPYEDSDSKLHSDDDDDYPENNRRINYSYHPIIDFFQSEAAMLKAPAPPANKKASVELTDDGNSWKPMIAV